MTTLRGVLHAFSGYIAAYSKRGGRGHFSGYPGDHTCSFILAWVSGLPTGLGEKRFHLSPFFASIFPLFPRNAWYSGYLYTAPIYSPALPFRSKDGGLLHKRISSFYNVPALWAYSWARHREDEGCTERTLRTPSWPHAAVNTNRVVVFPLQTTQPSYTTCVPSYNTCVYYY